MWPSGALPGRPTRSVSGVEPLDESRFRDHSVQSEVSLRLDAALYTQPALRDRAIGRGRGARGDAAATRTSRTSPKRTCCGRRAREKEEEVRRRRVASLAGRAHDAARPGRAAALRARGRSGARVRAAVHGVPGRGGLFCRRRGRGEAPAGGRLPADGAFFPPADTTPPAAADERDAARSALRRLQEMDSGHPTSRRSPRPSPTTVKPRAPRVELVPRGRPARPLCRRRRRRPGRRPGRRRTATTLRIKRHTRLPAAARSFEARSAGRSVRRTCVMHRGGSGCTSSTRAVAIGAGCKKRA